MRRRGTEIALPPDLRFRHGHSTHQTRRRTLPNESGEQWTTTVNQLTVAVELCELGHEHPIALLRGVGQIAGRAITRKPLTAFGLILWWAARERTATIEECLALSWYAYKAIRLCNNLTNRS